MFSLLSVVVGCCSTALWSRQRWSSIRRPWYRLSMSKKLSWSNSLSLSVSDAFNRFYRIQPAVSTGQSVTITLHHRWFQTYTAHKQNTRILPYLEWVWPTPYFPCSYVLSYSAENPRALFFVVDNYHHTQVHYGHYTLLTDNTDILTQIYYVSLMCYMSYENI